MMFDTAVALLGRTIEGKLNERHEKTFKPLYKLDDLLRDRNEKRERAIELLVAENLGGMKVEARE